jgi:hypothetical protein
MVRSWGAQRSSKCRGFAAWQAERRGRPALLPPLQAWITSQPRTPTCVAFPTQASLETWSVSRGMARLLAERTRGVATCSGATGAARAAGWQGMGSLEPCLHAGPCMHDAAGSG